MKPAILAICLIFAASEAFSIEKCRGRNRVTCVVDGDTFWLDGVKLRVAGYDTPEPQSNICGGRREVLLANKATARFIEILNTTNIQIEYLHRKGRMNRELVVVYSNGRDVGDILVAEGLAREWPDGREFWCE